MNEEKIQMTKYVESCCDEEKEKYYVVKVRYSDNEEFHVNDIVPELMFNLHQYFQYSLAERDNPEFEICLKKVTLTDDEFESVRDELTTKFLGLHIEDAKKLAEDCGMIPIVPENVSDHSHDRSMQLRSIVFYVNENNVVFSVSR